MSSASQFKRAWEAPVSTALSIRSTAGTVGPGGDNFMKHAVYGERATPPAAPAMGSSPDPTGGQTIATGEPERTWESPIVKALPI